MINQDRRYCYRICHIENVPHILSAGLCTKHHPNAAVNFIPIGNGEIIDVRENSQVKINGYGNIGDYVPFYFTPRSLMLYNIVTGYRAPVVPKLEREKILVIRCLISELATLGRFFFTNGQANTAITKHYGSLEYLGEIDWNIIQNSIFSNDGGDRQRRYQAEFLVHQHVPVTHIESLHVYNLDAARYVTTEMDKKGIINLRLERTPEYFF